MNIPNPEELVARIVAADEIWWMGRNCNGAFMGIRIGSFATSEEANADKVFAAMGITPKSLEPIFGKLTVPKKFWPLDERKSPFGYLGGIRYDDHVKWLQLAKLLKKKLNFAHCSGHNEVLQIVTYYADGTFHVNPPYSRSSSYR